MSLNLFHKERSSLKEQHDKYVAGASTFSKSIYRFPEQYPNFITKAKGCIVWDENNIHYIDFVSSLGTITLAYNHPEVNNAVKSQIDKGNLFSLCSDVESECGEVLTKVTGTDKCMFLKSGTDAVNASLKLARAYTNKQNIVYCSHGYHGWGDSWGISQPINKGIPSCLKDTIRSFEYDNIDSLKAVLDNNVAAVIMEQVTYSLPENKNFVNDVIKLTHDNGSLFILDNIVFFPRYTSINYNAQKSDIDMILLSKGMANGYSISAIVGKEDILKQRQNEEVFISGTFYGEAIGMSACIKTLEIANRDNLSKHIWDIGDKIRTGFNKLAQEKSVPIELYGLAPRMIFKYSNNSIKSLFLQETAHEHLLFGNIVYPTLSHTNRVINYTLEKCSDVLDIISSGIEQNIVDEMIIGRPCNDLNLRKK